MHSRDSSAFRWLPLCIAAVAFLTYAVLWSDGPEVESDSWGYLEVAGDLGDYTLDELHLRTPGYPLFLWLTGSSIGPSRILVPAQLLFYLAGILALGRVLGRIASGRWTEPGFVLAACLPHVIQPAGWLLAESLTQSLLALGLAALAAGALLGKRTSLVVAAALLFATCGTVRPVYQVTPVALAAALVLLATITPARRRRYLVAAAWLAVPTLLLAGLTAAGNRARFGAAGSPHLAFALAARMSNYVEYLPDDQAELREILVRHRDARLLEGRHHLPEGFIFEAWPELVERYGSDAARQALIRSCLALIRDDPRNFVRLVWESTARYWEWFSSAPPGLRHPAGIMVLFAFYHLTVACFAAGTAVMAVGALLWRSLSRPLRAVVAGELRLPAEVGHLLVVFLVAILAAMVVQTTLGVGVPRYRMPTEPLALFVVALYGDRFWLVRRTVRRIG